MLGEDPTLPPFLLTGNQVDITEKTANQERPFTNFIIAKGCKLNSD
jgi:hypothetical protein